MDSRSLAIVRSWFDECIWPIGCALYRMFPVIGYCTKVLSSVYSVLHALSSTTFLHKRSGTCTLAAVTAHVYMVLLPSF